MKRKIISLLLVLVLIVGIAPMASATGPEVGFDFVVFYDGTYVRVPNAEIFGYIDGVRAFQVTTDSVGFAYWDGYLPSATSEIIITIKPPGNYVVVYSEYYFLWMEHPYSVATSPNGTFTISGFDNLSSIVLLLQWDVAQTAEQPPPTPFTDVPSTAWFHDAVAFVYNEGLMRGASETTFDPLADFNREQVVATLFRMYHGRPANASDPTATPFADVDPGRWYAPYIAWAFEQGIVTGQTATTFGTGDPVTRQDFAVLAHRLASLMGADINVPSGFTLQFTDADAIGSWAQDALTWAVYAGLFTGTDEGLLNPWNTAIRAEAAAILTRYVQAVAE